MDDSGTLGRSKSWCNYRQGVRFPTGFMVSCGRLAM